MSAPTGSDASTDTDGSALKVPADVETDDAESESDDAGRSLDSPSEIADAMDALADQATDWARHWRAWGIALFSLLVAGWAAFLQPAASPKGYIPIFVGFAAIATGYVYLDEETKVQFASA